MVVCQSTNHAYYPMSDKGPALIRGSRRIRCFRGFVLVSPKGSAAVIDSRSRPERSKQQRIVAW
jgi:hypothetical protein